jgi:hypothetical protein
MAMLNNQRVISLGYTTWIVWGYTGYTAMSMLYYLSLLAYLFFLKKDYDYRIL